MDNRIVFGVLCICLNSYGVPCFLQGKIKRGVWRILANILYVPAIINTVKGIILGVEVLKMTDEEYVALQEQIAAYIESFQVQKDVKLEDVKSGLLMMAYSKDAFWQDLNEENQNDVAAAKEDC